MGKPKFEIERGRDEKHYWHLTAANGEIIAQSEGYESHAGAVAGIDAVRRGVLAEVGVDLDRRQIICQLETITEADGRKSVVEPITTHYVAIEDAIAEDSFGRIDEDTATPEPDPA